MFKIYWSLFGSNLDFMWHVLILPPSEHQSIAADWSQNGLGQTQPSTRGYRKMTWIESVLG